MTVPRPAAHPVELAGLADLHAAWTGAPELDGRFDPFRFCDRMAAYRLMIDRTNPDGLFGADNRRNPLWGLMFQHQWQFRTGRLGATARDDGRIDPDAPWGYGNYVLSVVPWLGAVDAGTVPELELAGPPGRTRFTYARAARELPIALVPGVADWRAYFALVAATPPGADDEPVRSALWKAHKTCLDVVARDVARLTATAYTDEETAFLRGWCRMVDFLWAAAWRTDFDSMTGDGLDVLPERLLGPGDDAPGGAGDLPRSDPAQRAHRDRAGADAGPALRARPAALDAGDAHPRGARPGAPAARRRVPSAAGQPGGTAAGARVPAASVIVDRGSSRAHRARAARIGCDDGCQFAAARRARRPEGPHPPGCADRARRRDRGGPDPPRDLAR